MAVRLFVVALFLFCSGANASGPTWRWSDATQGISNFSTEMSSCGSFEKAHLKAINNSGTFDVNAAFIRIHKKQCYTVAMSIFGKKRGDLVFGLNPIATDSINVCSGETKEIDTLPFRKGEHEALKLVGAVINNNPGFINLGALDIELSGVTYPIKDHILFAHGLGSTKSDFDKFASAAELIGATVYRYDVDRCASIAPRATALANQIKQDAALMRLPDNSLKVVGHSMGGLDLRYIVSKAHSGEEPFVSVAKKFKKVYTLATPHGGHYFADKLPDAIKAEVACADTNGLADLTDAKMTAFNQEYTYPNFDVAERPIPFLAFAFQCWSCGGGNDCVVGTGSQTWEGAPSYSTTLSGKHSKNLSSGVVGAGCAAELDNIDEVLCAILNDR